MKMVKIFWGVGFILFAVVLILDAVGVMAPIMSTVGEISLLTALLALLFLSYAISRLFKGKIGEIFIPLAFVFVLFEKNIAFVCGLEGSNIINNGVVFGCAALLWIGFSILFSGKKHNKNHGHFSGKRTRGGVNLAAAVNYIDASTFREEWVENNLGALSIYFENADKYEGGGILYVDNNLGATEINVPSSWRYSQSIDNSLGSVSAPLEGGDPEGPLLIIKGDNNLGAISIDFV